MYPKAWVSLAHGYNCAARALKNISNLIASKKYRAVFHSMVLASARDMSIWRISSVWCILNILCAISRCFKPVQNLMRAMSTDLVG